MASLTLSLPKLQALLDDLRPSQCLSLAEPRVEQLFGLNAVASARISRFARGRRCRATRNDGAVTFEKLPPTTVGGSLTFTRTCRLPDIELACAHGTRVNPSDFAGHQLLVMFCPANLPDAMHELEEYNSLADALAFNDAFLIVICDPNTGLPASRVTLASDPEGLAWEALAGCLEEEVQADRDKGAAFLLGRGGCLNRSWHGQGHAQSVRKALSERM